MWDSTFFYAGLWTVNQSHGGVFGSAQTPCKEVAVIRSKRYFGSAQYRSIKADSINQIPERRLSAAEDRVAIFLFPSVN